MSKLSQQHCSDRSLGLLQCFDSTIRPKAKKQHASNCIRGCTDILRAHRIPSISKQTHTTDESTHQQQGKEERHARHAPTCGNQDCMPKNFAIHEFHCSCFNSCTWHTQQIRKHDTHEPRLSTSRLATLHCYECCSRKGCDHLQDTLHILLHPCDTRPEILSECCSFRATFS